jgi:hypothetical protein
MTSALRPEPLPPIRSPNTPCLVDERVITMMILPGLLDHSIVRILVVPEFNALQIARYRCPPLMIIARS